MEKIKALTLLHLTHKLSIFFILGNFIILMFYEGSHLGNHYGGLFIWSLLMCGLTIVVKEKTKYFPLMLLPWVAIPWFLEVPLYHVGYLAFLSLFIVALFIKNKEEPNYDTIEFEFGLGVALSIFLLLLSFITGAVEIFNNVAAGYLLIFILSGVLLLRSLRYLEYNAGGEHIKKANLQSLGIILTLSIVLSTPLFMSLFQEFRSFLWRAYNALIDFVLWVFYWPIYYFGIFFNEVFRRMEAWFRRMQEDMDEDLQGTSESVPEEMEQFMEALEGSGLAENPILRFLLGGLVIILIFYILYKLYVRKGISRGVKETYTERKEVILPNKERGLWQRVKNRLKPKSREERVRSYYRGFLHNLEGKGVVLLDSDTTKDFYRKGSPYYSEEDLLRFRNIYLQVRYGNKPVDSKTYKEAKALYAQLVKDQE